MFPVIQASKFVAFETPFSGVPDDGGNTASAVVVEDQGDAFLDLLKCDCRCPFFFRDGFPSPRTKWR